MADPHKASAGDIFQIEGRWYQKVGDRGARALTAEQVQQIRLERARTPRNLPQETPEATAISRDARQTHPYQADSASHVAARARKDSNQDSRFREGQNSQGLRPEAGSQRTNTQTYGRIEREVSSKELGYDESLSGLKRLEIVDPVDERPSQSSTNRHRTGRTSRADVSQSEQSRMPQMVETTTTDLNVLTGLICYFVKIPENDFAQRAVFLTEYPELLRSDLTKLYKEALYQMSVNNSDLAKQCISSLAIIKQCDNLKNHPEFIEKRVNALSNPKSERYQQYREMFASLEEDIMDVASQQVSQQSAPAVPKSRHPAPEEAQKVPSGAMLQKPRHGTGQQPSLPQQTGYGSSINTIDRINTDESGKPRAISTEDLLDSLSENISRIATKAPEALQIPPEQFADIGMQRLSSSYQIRDHASTFFIPGRVFSMLWHEAAGQRAKPKKVIDQLSEPSEDYMKTKLIVDQNITVGAYGQEIYSHIRRHVVIRGRAAYCWCISIGTYGGQGLRKKGLKQDDIHAHTIIHDSRYKPQRLPKEPETSKRPIAVKLKPGQTLSSASRLHYGKPCTVEYNTPVQDVGMIEKKDLAILLSDVVNELLGDLGDLPPS